MTRRLILVCTALNLVLMPPAYSDPIATFPTWRERTLLELINRARSDPSAALAECGANCSAAELQGCYVPHPPLPRTYPLNTAARFHSDSMARNDFFAHDTSFIVRDDITAVYPAVCDGSAACASAGVGTTSAATRVSLFGSDFIGESVAHGGDLPIDAYRAWVLENAPNATCAISQANADRYMLLADGRSAGIGYANVPQSQFGSYWTADLGPALSVYPPKISSGSHWGAANSSAPSARQADVIEFWANWFYYTQPVSATVVVDATANALTLERGTVYNGAWSATVAGLGSGCHHYFFVMTDNQGDRVRYPTTGQLGIGDSTCADFAFAPRADFNEDMKSDILWRNNSSGENVMWLMNGTSILSAAFLPPVEDLSWKVEATGEFTSRYEATNEYIGDGRQEILWRYTDPDSFTPGLIVLWQMDGPVRTDASSHGGTPLSVSFVATGDTNGNGIDDIFSRDSSFGGVGRGDGFSNQCCTGTALPTVSDLNFSVAGAGDFNDDGRTDLLWRNGVTGENVVWFMDAVYLSAATYTLTVSDTNWKIVGVGDANVDRKADVFWWNQVTGDVVVWLMNGATVTSAKFITTVSNTNWHVEAVGDFDGDGKTDLMWRNVATGDVVVWLMDGATLRYAAYVTTVTDLNWAIVAPK